MSGNLGGATFHLDIDDSKLIDGLNKALAAVNAAGAKMASAYTQSGSAAGSAFGGSLVKGIEKTSFSDVGKKIESGLKAAVGNVGQGIGQGIGQSIANNIQSALSRIGGAAIDIKNLSDLDAASRKASTLTGDIGGLKKAAFDLSKELGNTTTAAKILDSSYDVLSSGFSDTADVIGILKAAQVGAVGGFSDINTVANATTSIINAYGLSAKAATGIIQKMAGTQNAGKLTIDEYANNIGKLASTAAQAGVSLDEVNGIIANATAKGVRVSSAFDGYRQALASVLKPSDDAGKLAAQLGINFDAAALKSGGIVGIFKQLGDRATPENLIRLFGSVEAVAAIMPSAAGGMKDYAKALDTIAKTDAMDAFKKVSGGIAQQTEALQNKLIDFDAKLKSGVIGEALASGLSALSGVMGGLIDFIEKLNAGYQKLDPGAKEFVKVTGAIVLGVGAAAIGITGLAVAVGLVSGAFTAGMGALAAFGGGLAAVTLAAAPWIIAIGAVSLAVYGLYRAFGGSATSIPQFVGDIGRGMTRFKDLVVGAFDTAIKWVQNTAKSFGDMVGSFGKNQPILGKILDGLTAPFKYLFEIGNWAFNGLVKSVEHMGKVFAKIFNGIIEGAKGIGNALKGLPGMGGGEAQQPAATGGASGGAGSGAGTASPLANMTLAQAANYVPRGGITPNGLRVQDPFAKRPGGRTHHALDLSAPAGTPVQAIASGTATFTPKVSYYGGKYSTSQTLLEFERDGKKIRALYFHLGQESAKYFKDGYTRQVKAGDVIGVVGKDGAIGGNEEHLDLKIWINGQRVADPRTYLRDLDKAVKSTAQAASSTTTANTGISVNASTYHPGGGGMNGKLLDSRGKRLLPNDYAVAFAALGRGDGIPYGSNIKVTNPANGRSVFAEARDGGPYVPGRQMDVTTAVKKAIGFSGLGKLQIELVGVPKGADPSKTYWTGEAKKYNSRMSEKELTAASNLAPGMALKVAGQNRMPVGVGTTVPTSQPYSGVAAPTPQVAAMQQQTGTLTLRKAEQALSYAQADYDRQVALIAALKKTPTGRNQKLIDANNAKIAAAEVTLENRRRNLLSKKDGYQKALETEQQRQKEAVDKALARDLDPIQRQVGFITANTNTRITGIDRMVARKDITPAQGEKLRSEELAKQSVLLDKLQPKIEELWKKYSNSPEALTTLLSILDNIQKQGVTAANSAGALKKASVTDITKYIDSLSLAKDRRDMVTDISVARGDKSKIDGDKERAANLALMAREVELLLPMVTELMATMADDESQNNLGNIIRRIQGIRLESAKTQQELGINQTRSLVSNPLGIASELEAGIKDQRTAGLISERAEQERLLKVREDTNDQLLLSIPLIEAFQRSAKDEDSVKTAKELLATIRRYNAETTKARTDNAASASASAFNDIRSQIERTKNNAEDEQRRIRNEALLGIIKQREEEEKLLDVRLATSDALDKLKPKLQALYDAEKSEEVKRAIADQILGIQTFSAEAVNARDEQANASLKTREISQAVADSTREAFADLFRGAKNLGSILDGLLNKLADIVINAAFDKFLKPGILSIFGFAHGTRSVGTIPNFANGIADALARERAQSGRRPFLAALHEGEAVLSTLNGDSQLYNQMLRDGRWAMAKATPNYANGTASAVMSRPSMGTSSTNRIVVDRINKVDYVTLEQVEQIIAVESPLTVEASLQGQDQKLRGAGYRKRMGIR
jgi:TP901 family phage tail tape measure protein